MKHNAEDAVPDSGPEDHPVVAVPDEEDGRVVRGEGRRLGQRRRVQQADRHRQLTAGLIVRRTLKWRKSNISFSDLVFIFHYRFFF